MEKDMEFGEHENQVQGEMRIQVSPPSPLPETNSLKNSTIKIKTSVIVDKVAATAPPGHKSRPTVETPIVEKVAATAPPGLESGPTVETIIYRECQKNHAISIGGYAFDGCGEFLGAGEEGTLEAVICAACNCHRNFHRKVTDNVVNMRSYRHQPWLQPQPPLHAYCHYVPPPPPPVASYHHHLVATPPVSQHRPLALPTAFDGGFSREEDVILNPRSNDGGGSPKKRFRTKFTTEQKDKMLVFAKKLGWRIKKHDATLVEQFCTETGVKKQVLMVWMQNNKHILSQKA